MWSFLLQLHIGLGQLLWVAARTMDTAKLAGVMKALLPATHDEMAARGRPCVWNLYDTIQ